MHQQKKFKKRKNDFELNESLAKRIKSYKSMYLFLLPAIITITIFSYAPMVGVVMAFQNYNVKTGFITSPWVGLQNFRDVFASIDFLHALKNTLGINVLLLIIGFPCTIIFALIVNEVKTP